MKILLVNPPHNGYLKPPPLGLLSLAAVLRNERHLVRLFDCLVEPEGEEGLISEAIQFQPSVIGITCISWTATSAFSIGKKMRKLFPSVKIIYGGVHPSFLPWEPFEEGAADVVVRGEAESVICELIRNDKKIPSKIIYSSEQARKEVNNSNWLKMQPDLSSLPIPAYDLVPYSNYKSSIHIRPYRNEQAADIMATRGCPYNCLFCAIPNLYGRSLRYRSLDSIVSEIELIRERYNIKFIHFYDDDFFFNADYALKLAQALHKKMPEILWLCQARVDSVLKMGKILREVHSLGCVAVELGIEAAEESALSGMNKMTNCSQGLSATKLLRKWDIQTLYLTLSYAPGETINGPWQLFNYLSMAETGNLWSVNSSPDLISNPIIYGHLMTPIAGSDLFYNCDRFGRNLLRSRDDMYLERINFIPFSLINGIPVKSGNFDSNRFQEMIYFCIDRGLYIGKSFFIENQILVENYVNLGKTVFENCNGNFNLLNITKSIIGSDSDRSISIIASLICILSACGYIQSKK